jgi:hypothetical protein
VERPPHASCQIFLGWKVNLNISLIYDVFRKLKKLLPILTALVVYGCVSTGPASGPTLLHEASEPEIMTKQEFMDRVAQSATLIYEGMRAINDAAKQYATDNDGKLPGSNISKVKELLLDGGYIEQWPVIPPFAFTDPIQYELKYTNGYADMDGIGAVDDVIYAQDLKNEVCEEFILRYSSAGPEDIIYDYEANRERYPGEVFGRHMKIYAINWYGTNPDGYCDIEWVMQYND